ncbi:hypothetical protein Anapl_08481 [Anas platyrhynchos]|uniref:Uncharacterized protein n=1 Tax=Anas platyrhynchos TaxID=8839 RepID=R0L095_ANAPL|nr:hypothetical protein Anapl_08481 [Anas platyrhynchos]
MLLAGSEGGSALPWPCPERSVEALVQLLPNKANSLPGWHSLPAFWLKAACPRLKQQSGGWGGGSHSVLSTTGPFVLRAAPAACKSGPLLPQDRSSPKMLNSPSVFLQEDLGSSQSHGNLRPLTPMLGSRSATIFSWPLAVVARIPGRVQCLKSKVSLHGRDEYDFRETKRVTLLLSSAGARLSGVSPPSPPPRWSGVVALAGGLHLRVQEEKSGLARAALRPREGGRAQRVAAELSRATVEWESGQLCCGSRWGWAASALLDGRVRLSARGGPRCAVSEAPDTPGAGVGLAAVLAWLQRGRAAGVGGGGFNPPLSTALHKQYNAHRGVQSVHFNAHSNVVCNAHWQIARVECDLHKAIRRSQQREERFGGGGGGPWELEPDARATGQSCSGTGGRERGFSRPWSSGGDEGHGRAAWALFGPAAAAGGERSLMDPRPQLTGLGALLAPAGCCSRLFRLRF